MSTAFTALRFIGPQGSSSFNMQAMEKSATMLIAARLTLSIPYTPDATSDAAMVIRFISATVAHTANIYVHPSAAPSSIPDMR